MLLLLASALVSCDGGTSPSVVVPCSDDQEVIISVSSGLQPTFTWEPACGMASIQVWASATSTDGWVLYSGANSAANPLRPGVKYGEAPFGAIAPSPAAALVPGEEYTVAVYRWIGDASGAGSLFSRGIAVFIPSR
jgi:hypothetical protein